MPSALCTRDQYRAEVTNAVLVLIPMIETSAVVGCYFRTVVGLASLYFLQCKGDILVHLCLVLTLENGR